MWFLLLCSITVKELWSFYTHSHYFALPKCSEPMPCWTNWTKVCNVRDFQSISFEGGLWSRLHCQDIREQHREQATALQRLGRACCARKDFDRGVRWYRVRRGVFMQTFNPVRSTGILLEPCLHFDMVRGLVWRMDDIGDLHELARASAG